MTGLPGATMTRLPSAHFPVYYSILVPQPLDHLHPAEGTFFQRVFVGIQDFSAPVVLVTDGYGVDYAAKPSYQHELARILEANLVVVEHRFFGLSQPKPLDYRWLTVAQAAADVHAIRALLGPYFEGKWLGTGTSKGGQAALAHRMRYPHDVAATVVYGTAIKRAPTISTTALLAPLLQTDCGRRVAALQHHAFHHDDSLFPAFAAQVATLNLDFGDMPLRLVWDYIRLEYPYSFWQSGGNCTTLPALTTDAATLVRHLLLTVPPKYYSRATRKRWEPAYYMFYHELGYYEYDVAPFQQQLSAPSHSNRYFCPDGVEIAFDRHYLQDLGDFLDGPTAHAVFFIYGANDPWALQSTVTRNRYEVAGGNHGSKFVDLPPETQADLLRRIDQHLGLDCPTILK